MSTDVTLARSPRYPRLSLMEALSHTKRLYDGAHRSVLDSNTAFRIMGYAGKTGASATVLGALRQYGLVRGMRGEVAVSDLALRIFEPSSPKEYADAVSEAADAPEPFKQIRAHFGAGVPKADEAIRSFLIRTLGFSKSGAEDCIRSFRETQAQAELERQQAPLEIADLPAVPPTDESSSTDTRSLLLVPGDGTGRALAERPDNQNANEFVRVPLAKNCVAELRFEGQPSREAVERLISYIELMKPIWVDEDGA